MHYVISDIHGEHKRFFAMLKTIKFRKKDKLYIIGDIPSRGVGTFEILDWVMTQTNVIHIKGNHELFLQKYLEQDVAMLMNYSKFGGNPVINALQSMFEERKANYCMYLSQLPLYHVITINEDEYILTHSGFMADQEPIYREDGTIDLIASIHKWGKAFEYQYLISSDLHFIPASNKLPKLIVGHYPTFHLGCDGIYIGKRYIDIDNGVNTIPNKKLACLRLEDMKEYYI